jgi:hypothetical protein
MELLAPFTDSEDIGLELFESVGPTALVTPDVITTPLIVVSRTGGADDYLTDIPRLQVDTLAPTHRQAVTLAELCRQRVLASPATGVAGVSIDRAWTESAPSYLDYGDKSVHRYVAAYRLAFRRPR